MLSGAPASGCGTQSQDGRRLGQGHVAPRLRQRHIGPLLSKCRETATECVLVTTVAAAAANIVTAAVAVVVVWVVLLLLLLLQLV